MPRYSGTRQLNSYLRAAPWPHLSTLACLLACLGLGWLGWRLPGWGYGAAVWPAWSGAVVMLISAALCQADAWARWQDYRRVSSLFQRHGWRPLFLTPLCRSRCQRDAVLLAARQAGFGSRTQAWFHAKGYRWYHLAPDRVKADPRLIVNASFLKATFLPRVGRGDQA